MQVDGRGKEVRAQGRLEEAGNIQKGEEKREDAETEQAGNRSGGHPCVEIPTERGGHTGTLEGRGEAAMGPDRQEAS